MARIKKITVSNLKAITALSADFNGCTAIITGGNNKGKTSFLRSLTDRLRGLKPEVIVKQGEKEGIYEMELTTGEKFIWNFNNTTKAGERLTYISEKNIKSAVTKNICTAYFPEIFDVDAFLNSPPAKQKAVLQKLTGIDFTEFDQQYKAAYDERTFRNKAYNEENARCTDIDNTLPVEEVSTEILEKELAGIDLHNLQYSTIEKAVKDKQNAVKENNEEIDRLMALVEKLGEKNASLNEEITKGNAWLNDDKHKPKNNIDALKASIAEVKMQNEKIIQNNNAKQQFERAQQAKKKADEADAAIKKLQNEKEDIIKKASLPEGFGFSDEGITYNGFDFNKQQLSSSGIYIAALKLAAIGLGEVKTLHFDASFLDKISLAEIEAWANANNLQLLIERPDFEGGEIKYEIIETD